jgi:hypothetical protein
MGMGNRSNLVIGEGWCATEGNQACPLATKELSRAAATLIDGTADGTRRRWETRPGLGPRSGVGLQRMLGGWIDTMRRNIALQ